MLVTLSELGWTDDLARAFASHEAAGYEPARVVCELRRKFYAVQTAAGEFLGECGGGYFHGAERADQFPAVGDWVAVKVRPDETRADIHALLPRRTKFSRRAAGSEEIEQIVAANIDTVFLVSGLDQNFNPKRIQRFVVAAKESGAEAVILLNKSDVCDDPERVRREIETLVPGVPVVITSTETRKGLKQVTSAYARPGQTVAFVGSSGVGKSSLINSLLKDDAMPTAEVREKDSKGRHTTTRRELVVTPSGALVIDTPGMRELQLWDVTDGVEEAFADVTSVAVQCRFTNCTHTTEPGCAVQKAIREGTIPVQRLESYRKLKAEHLARAPAQKKPGSIANKPGWRKNSDHQAPFRHRHHREE